jgi:hypothetical protein
MEANPEPQPLPSQNATHACIHATEVMGKRVDIPSRRGLQLKKDRIFIESARGAGLFYFLSWNSGKEIYTAFGALNSSRPPG